MRDNGIQPIADKFLLPNFLLALEFDEGFVFGRVIRRRVMHYKPWPLIDSAGAAVDIAKSTHQAELRFRDPRNPVNDILYLDASTNSGYPWFLHGSMGLRPQYIYMYPRFPEGKEIPGKFPNVDPIKPSGGEDLGYVSSLESPYDEPTDYVEWVIPPGQHVGAEYYNKDPDRAHQPVLNILFCCYWFQAFTRERHSKLISSIAARSIPAAFLTVGWGDTPIDLGDTLREDWKVEPMSLDQALGGGR